MSAQATYSFTLKDELGVTGSMVVYADVNDASVPADLAADWQTLATAIDAASGCKITHGRVTLLEAMTGGKGTPAAGSRIEQSAVLNFGNAATTRRQGIVLPGVKDALIVNDRLVVASGALQTLINLLSAGTALAKSTPANAAYQAATTLIDAFLAFRKRRRQLERATIE